MKTLTLTTIICGVLWCNFAFSFTTWNLPVEGIFQNPVDNLLVFDNPNLHLNITDLSPDQTSETNLEDTIVVNLAEVVITDGFPVQAEACLQKRVKYPEFARKHQIEGVVAVSLRFNDAGNVEIMDAFGSNDQLKDYVLSQLMGLHPSNCYVKINKLYSLRFSFRLF